MLAAAVDVSVRAVPAREPAVSAEAGREPGAAGASGDHFATVLGGTRAAREDARTPGAGRARVEHSGNAERAAPGHAGNHPGASRRAAARRREEEGTIDRHAQASDVRPERTEGSAVKVDRLERHVPGDAAATSRADAEATRPGNESEGEATAVAGVETAGQREVASAVGNAVIGVTASTLDRLATAEGAERASPSETPSEPTPPSGEPVSPEKTPGQAATPSVARAFEAEPGEAKAETSLPASRSRAGASPERHGGSEARATEGERSTAEGPPRAAGARENVSPEASARPREDAGAAPSKGNASRAASVPNDGNPTRTAGETGSTPAGSAASGRSDTAAEQGVARVATDTAPTPRRTAETGVGETGRDSRDESGPGTGAEGRDGTPGRFDERLGLEVARGAGQTHAGSKTVPGAARADAASAPVADGTVARGNGDAPGNSAAAVPESAPPSRAVQSQQPQQGPDAAARPAMVGATLRAEQALAADLERGVIARVRDGGEMRLALQPAGLGEVELRVAVRDGGVHAHLATAHEEARQLLTSHRHDLETALQRYHLRLDSFDVDVGGREGRSFFDREPQPSGVGTWMDGAVSGTDAEATDDAVVPVRTGASGGALSIRV